MRHGDKINHLGRTYAHRKSMLTNMACSLIKAKRINTTLAKAKELRGFIEPLLTISKDDIKFQGGNNDQEKAYNASKRMSARRLVFARLRDKQAVNVLFSEVTPKIVDRQGGYTRILKTGIRLGDNAKTCMMELVDFNETYNTSKKVAKAAPKTRRSRSKKAANTEAPAAEEPKAE